MSPNAAGRAPAPFPGNESGGRSPAFAAIRACLDDGRTGCLTASDAGLGVVEVYVMTGEVLAAHADDDDVRLLARISASGLLPAEILDALAESCTAPGEFTEALYGVLDESVVQDLLYERFRENLFAFLGASRTIEFQPMEALFVANIQVGHDSARLVEELASLRDRVAPLLSSRLTLLPGEAPGSTPEDAAIVELCVNGLTVAELLRRAGDEPNRVLHSAADLLDAGALRWDGALPPASPQPAPSAPMSPAPPASFDLPEEDEHTEDSAQRSGVISPATNAPREVAEEYLDAFGDYDTVRGEGSFSGVRDRVDLADIKEARPPEPAGPPELIELPEADAAAHAGAISLNFSGPRLADDDARGKIEVVNEVLEAVRAAIDYINGGGSGQARVQLIVDGSSGPFAALFNGIEIRADGRLPVEQVLKNLRKRPITEHRPLLQRAATDLIERALSMASEDLDEGLMEQVLEKVAGYQKRLGI